MKPNCWCGNGDLAPFSSDYLRCLACETLVAAEMPGPEISRVVDDQRAFYGHEYWLSHQEEDLGYPTIVTRARTDLPERCLHWLSTLLKYKLPPARILELGSAHGGFVALLRQAGFDAIGLELSPWVVAFARRTFDVPVLLGPIEDQPIEAGSLDGIALMDVLEHLPDPVATMRHCLGLLKPDGILVVQTPCYPEGKTYEEMMAQGDRFLEQMSKPKGHLYLFSRSSIREFFRRLGAEHLAFEPAIFGHYDMFLVVSRAPLVPYPSEEIERTLSETSRGRVILALLDLRAEVHRWLEENRGLWERVNGLQEIIAAIQQTRAYRLLRRLGRWKWVEQRLLSIENKPGGTDGPLPEPQFLAKLIAEYFLHDHTLFPVWEAHGFHITPVHFYSPIPTISELPEKLWTTPSELVGIELNEEKQIEFLERICVKFKGEYDTFPHNPTGLPHQYYFNQMMFRSVDAEVLYCMIRHSRPRRIVEIGSGFSTYVAAAAGLKNTEEGDPVELIAVDPYPNEVLRGGFPGLSRLIPRRVQDVDPQWFTALEGNDILFIDSSHTVRIDSDVRLLVLEVLPRLKPGVLVHFHDIFLPYDYPREWVVKEHRFWTEQYLVQAFLAFNYAFEVVWMGSYMHIHHSEKLKKAFASYDPARVWPGSLWIRRKV